MELAILSAAPLPGRAGAGNAGQRCAGGGGGDHQRPCVHGAGRELERVAQAWLQRVDHTRPLALGGARRAVLARAHLHRVRHLHGPPAGRQRNAAHRLGARVDTVDWLVPPGAYTYRDLPTLGALQQIAGAVGAVVQSHQSDNVLTVLPRYPISPWEWSAADPSVAITADIVTSSASEWQPRPDYNGVYVMGTTQGVSVWVRRTGCAGEPLAPQVSDALITHVDAGTERGRIILAAAGRWSSETIQIPLMPVPQPPGLLLPGALIEVDDGIDTWRGQVLSVRISAQRGDSLTVWQTVEVERWHG